jgi:GNAT superfamily N-acetyltransferase
MLANGLSLAAVDVSSGTLVGCFTAEDFATLPPREAASFPTKHGGGWPVLFELLGLVDDEFKRRCVGEGLPPQGRFNHLCCLAVAPTFARRGIGGALSRLVLANAGTTGYRTSFAEATSHFSKVVLLWDGGDLFGSVCNMAWIRTERKGAWKI